MGPAAHGTHLRDRHSHRLPGQRCPHPVHVSGCGGLLFTEQGVQTRLGGPPGTQPGPHGSGGCNWEDPRDPARPSREWWLQLGGPPGSSPALTGVVATAGRTPGIRPGPHGGGGHSWEDLRDSALMLPLVPQVFPHVLHVREPGLRPADPAPHAQLAPALQVLPLVSMRSCSCHPRGVLGAALPGPQPSFLDRGSPSPGHPRPSWTSRSPAPGPPALPGPGVSQPWAPPPFLDRPFPSPGAPPHFLDRGSPSPGAPRPSWTGRSPAPGPPRPSWTGGLPAPGPPTIPGPAVPQPRGRFSPRDGPGGRASAGTKARVLLLGWGRPAGRLLRRWLGSGWRV